MCTFSKSDQGGVCQGCGAPMCGRQQVMSRILGGWSTQRCLVCLEAALGSTPDEMCRQVGNYLARRDCYRRDWCDASICDRDGQSACCPSRLEAANDPPAWYAPEMFSMAVDSLPEPDLEVDTAAAGSGDLFELLVQSILELEPGEVLALTARHPTAAIDVPHWSRLTGHPLLAGPIDPDGATYYLRRKH